MQICGVGQTSVGKVREHNEDFFLVEEELGLYIVCDGMGGHAAGEVASALAVQTVQQHLRDHRKHFQPFKDSVLNREDLIRLVKDAVNLACQTVFDQGNANPEQAGMGCTLTMMLVVGGLAVIAHVGDSRLYLRRNGKVYKLSNDHTLATELLYNGVISPEEAQYHPQSHILTRAIGLQRSVKVDTLLFEIMLYDTFLVCSDGFSNSVYQPEELALLLQEDLTSLPDQLINLANERDGSDNITTIVLRAEPDEDEDTLADDQKRQKELQLRMATLREVFLFEHLSLKELAQIMYVAKVSACEAGDVLIKEGGNNDTLYITLEGQLSVSRGAHEITVLNPGSHVGEMALLNRRPRSATVRAVEPSRLISLERTPFYQLIREEPLIGVKLLWRLAQELSLRLDETNEQFYGPYQPEEHEILDPPFSET